MLKKIILILLVISLTLPNLVFGEELVEEILDSPLYLTIEKKEDYFTLRWKNPDTVKYHFNLEYEVDFKMDNSPWISTTNILLPSGYLLRDEKDYSYVDFDPIHENLLNEEIDLKNNNYSFRIRYKNGKFSNPVTIGITDYYRNASSWAETELNRAITLDFITESIREDMLRNITREEFCEVLMKMYVKRTGKSLSYSDTFFYDTENPEILKAAELGIVTGDGYGKFRPEDHVTREDICTMIYRVINLFYPDLDYSIEDVDRFKDEEMISTWGTEPLKFMYKNNILRGDGYGIIDPLGNSTREVAVLLVLRTYEKFK